MHSLHPLADTRSAHTCRAQQPGSLPGKWLVVRLSALGDVVLTTGVLHFLHQQYGWTFAVLTRSRYVDSLKNHPAIEHCITPVSSDLCGPGWISFCSKTATQYRGWGLLDLHVTLRSRVLRILWKGPVRQYPKYSLLRRLHVVFSHAPFRKYLEKTTVPQRYALAIEKVPPPLAALRPCISLSAEEKKTAHMLLAALFSGSSQPRPALAALHPYATHPAKCWPIRHWHTLIALLITQGWHCVVIGNTATSPLYNNTPPPECTDLTNTTNLRETCAVLSRCEVLITNDSGPMHLGTAVQTPVIGLFGPTVRAWGFFPTGENDRVLEAHCSCRPCSLHGKKSCGQQTNCMESISPEEVLAALPPRPCP